MSFIIIANILALISNGLNGISSFFKSKKAILLVQTLECLIGGIAQLFANSISAATQLFICTVRNFIASKNFSYKWIYWLFSTVFLITGIYFNNRGYIGLFPVFATIQYTLWTGYCKSAQGIRYGMVINYIPWIIHDFYIQMYVSAMIMTVATIITVVNILRYAKDEGNKGF